VALIVETSLASSRAVLRGIASYVREHQPWSIYHAPRDLEEDVPNWLSEWQGDGIIARVQNRQIADAVRQTGLPVVDALGLVPDAGFPLVHVDDGAIAALAAGHFFDCGFKHFGFCGLEAANWSENRSAGFERLITAAGYQCHHYRLPAHQTLVTWEEQQEFLADWIRSLPKPVAIMACNDPRGQLVLEASGRARISVPDEVAVIGVDNDEPLCEVANPTLSSVAPDHLSVGYEAAALLDSLIEGHTPPAKPIYLPPKGIVIRQSTDVIAVKDPHVISAVRFIRNFACEGISVEDVVDQADVSRSVLQRRFKKYLGHTVHEIIIRTQIKRAKELLLETELTIAAIAEKTGFRHTEYLGVVFKDKTGMSPGQYRREQRS